MKFSSTLLSEVVDFDDLVGIELDESVDWALRDFDEETPTIEDISVLTDESIKSDLVPKKRRYKKRVAKSSVVSVITKPAPCHPRPKLYVFPSFDKSDAIIYMPSTIARLTNTGDIDRMTKLIRGHCSKDCEVIMGADKENGITLPMTIFTSLLECATILYPDIISCMHTTKVIENQIHATMYFKYTDYAALPDHARTIPSVRDNELNKIVFTAPRKENLAQKLRLDAQPEDIGARIRELLDLEEEIQMYGKEDVIITIDQHTKKVISYQSDCVFVSVCHNGQQYKLV